MIDGDGARSRATTTGEMWRASRLALPPRRPIIRLQIGRGVHVPGARVSDRAQVVETIRPRRLTGAHVQYLAGVLLLAVGYYAAAKVGYRFEFAGPVAAIVWFPCGVGMAALYIAGLRFWPGVLLGDLLANDYGALPLGSALGQTAGNVLEALVAAMLLHRLVRERSPLETVPNLARMVVALLLATATSATIGTSSLLAGGVVAQAEVATVWRTWLLGDFCGALVAVPLALAFLDRNRPRPRGRFGVEAAACIAVTAVVSELASRTTQPMLYLVFPCLAWATLRFGHRGATLGVVISTGLIVWNTTRYAGPFAYNDITTSVLSTQLFVVVQALSALVLAALVSEREEMTEQLTASRRRLFTAADTERRRIDRNLHDGVQARLTALAVQLRLAGLRTRTEPADAPVLLERAEEALQLAMDDLREVAHGIHPAALRWGLEPALATIADTSSTPVTVVGAPSGRIDPTVEATAYYVVAEAVANAQRHAGATFVRVRLAPVRSYLSVEVVDDGRGGATFRVGSGLEGLRDRVEALGGEFRLDSPPGGGTRILAGIPLSS
jgi:signal transduction histidine kinase